MSTESIDPTYYVDMGASSHITNDPGNLINLVPYKGHDKIMVGDGSDLHISQVGDCMTYKNIKLKEVLIVPEANRNLIFVSQLAKDNYCICEFTASGFVIKDRETGRVLAMGSKQGNLFALNRDIAAALVAVKSGKAPEYTWH